VRDVILCHGGTIRLDNAATDDCKGFHGLIVAIELPKPFASIR
jgi:hypothetical protein